MVFYPSFSPEPLSLEGEVGARPPQTSGVCLSPPSLSPSRPCLGSSLGERSSLLTCTQSLVGLRPSPSWGTRRDSLDAQQKALGSMGRGQVGGDFSNLWMEETETQSSVLLKPQRGAGKERPFADAPLCPGHWVSADVYVYL